MTSRSVWVDLVTSMYFSGRGNVCSWGTQSWTRDRWNHLGSTRSRQGLQRHLLILSIETPPVHLEVLHRDLRSLQVVPVLEWILGILGLLLTILLFHLLLGIWLSSPICEINTSFALMFRGLISDASNFSKSSRSAIRMSPFQISPRSMHTQEGFLVKLVLPTWWSLDWCSFRNRIIFNHCSTKN